MGNFTLPLPGSAPHFVMVSLWSCQQDSFTEQVESGAAIHLPFEHLDPVDVAFDLAGAVGQGQAVEAGSRRIQLVMWRILGGAGTAGSAAWPLKGRR